MLFVSAIAECLLPWWSLGIVCFIVAVLMKWSPGKSFLGGFIAIFLLWAGWSLWWDIPNHHILSAHMAVLFHLPNYMLFVLVTSILGGLVGGLSAWSGTHTRLLFGAKHSSLKTR